MVHVDDARLADPARLAAVERLRRTLPALSVSLDAIASLAARLLNAPMASVSLVTARRSTSPPGSAFRTACRTSTGCP